ncbi:MAG: hypothetical protein RL549_945, partial [Verrucomicrobiota bacterium]
MSGPTGLESGDGGEEALGVGVGRMVGDLLGGAFLDEFAVFQHGDLVADVLDDGEVM